MNLRADNPMIEPIAIGDSVTKLEIKAVHTVNKINSP